MTDIEILETIVGGRMIKEMSALEFMGFIARKLNGVTVNNQVRELSAVVASPPMTNNLSPDSKVEYCRKLMAAGITL